MLLEPKPPAGRQRKRREVRRLGDTDLRVRGRHLTFRGGNVGTPLEQLRRAHRRESAGIARSAIRPDRQVRRRLTDQYGNRVFDLRALHADVDRLRLRALQLLLGQHQSTRAATPAL